MDHERTREPRAINEDVLSPRRAAQIFDQLASTLAFAQALVPLDVDDPSLMMRRTRRLCGRWLLHRQLIMRRTNGEIVQQTRLDAQTWRILTLGGAQPDCVPPHGMLVLTELLADGEHEPELVATVIDVACGRSDDADGLVRECVLWDLDEEYVPETNE